MTAFYPVDLASFDYRRPEVEATPADWELHARLAYADMRRIVEGVRPLCHEIADTMRIRHDQILPLDHAVNGCLAVMAHFDANHEPEIPLPRWVDGLFRIWQTVNRWIAADQQATNLFGDAA